MAEQVNPTVGAEQQGNQPVTLPSSPEATRPTQNKPATRPAVKTKAASDDRDYFIRNALPVAAALRRYRQGVADKIIAVIA
ncbi:MAG: hypothetical protein EOO55_03900, partial [Hymenobacter sp.]